MIRLDGPVSKKKKGWGNKIYLMMMDVVFAHSVVRLKMSYVSLS